MMSSRWITFVILTMLAIAAFAGFFRLFELRFEAGDVYPPYSSLRSDPLGTKVLYTALQAASGFTVSRNYQPLDKVAGPSDAVIFYPGASMEPWRLDDVTQLESLARNGGRIIVTFLPVEPGARAEHDKWLHKTRKLSKDDNQTKDDSEVETIEMDKLASRWGFGLGYRTMLSGTDGSAGLSAEATQPETESTLSWHTALSFPKPAAAWRVLYRCEGVPVIIERPFGHGSLLIAADSYFLSNEAMRSERDPRLLALILGSKTRVIFDETHLGVQEHAGIATLIRKYNLDGLIAAIGVLACLFIWRSSCPFLPACAENDDTEIVTGKDSASGFVSLLRRGIPPTQLIVVCVDQWKKTLPHGSSKAAGMIERIDRIMLTSDREPLAEYRSISQIVGERK